MANKIYALSIGHVIEMGAASDLKRCWGIGRSSALFSFLLAFSALWIGMAPASKAQEATPPMTEEPEEESINISLENGLRLDLDTESPTLQQFKLQRLENMSPDRDGVETAIAQEELKQIPNNKSQET
jgi:hypothetical protein